jgi:hypothetical protein
MKISNKKLFVDLNDFFSGCHILALIYENMVDDFRENYILTDHGLPVCILIKTLPENQKASTYKQFNLFN